VSSARNRKILVTGASVAGPAVAYWLAKRGFDVTLVERAKTIRSGGYAIDIRGVALDVVDRMGMLAQLRRAHVATRSVTFVNDKGREVARVDAESTHGGDSRRHVEVLRGDLTSLLYEATRQNVRYRFSDWIDYLSEDAEGVEVGFHSGERERFDLVISGEGMHSSTRQLVFGPESTFSHYLGYCFAVCELPNTYGLRREGALYNKPGKGVALYSTSDGPMLYGFFVNWRSPPTLEELADVALQRECVARDFAEDGWQVPKMIAAMREAEDFYFDSTMQIRMPAWSKGRVALVGDAAYAPSFFTGQGTSLAIVGAYVLAGALATRETHTQAFATYDAIVRPYVTINQAIVDKSPLVAPRTAREIWLRNQMIRLAPLLGRLGPLAQGRNKAYEGLDLPNFETNANPRAAA